MKYVKHKFTDKGVKVQFDAHGVYILFFTPDTPILELPKQVRKEATALWTPEYIDSYLDSLKPTNEEKEREAENEAEKIALEELISERIDRTSLDKVKSDIQNGTVTDARKAVRDEHKKLKK